jgi:hypothetical protein
MKWQDRVKSITAIIGAGGPRGVSEQRKLLVMLSDLFKTLQKNDRGAEADGLKSALQTATLTSAELAQKVTDLSADLEAAQEEIKKLKARKPRSRRASKPAEDVKEQEQDDEKS